MKSYIVERSVYYEPLTKFENTQHDSIADMSILIWHKCMKTCLGMTNFKFGMIISKKGKKMSR